MTGPASDHPIFRSRHFLLARFHCPAGSPAWSSENRTSEDAVVLAFARAPVAIRHEGQRSLVADRTAVMLYNPGQRYRRQALDPRGDNCLYIGADTTLIAEALAEFAPSTAGHPDRPLPRPRAERSREADSALAALRALAHTDPLAAEAEGMRLIRAVAAACAGAPARPLAPVRDSTRRHHAELVEQARAVLARTVAQPFSLADLARAVHSSPYHLARIFRDHTGRSIGEHRAELRLRESLDLLLESDTPIAHIALAVGYSSHAHFATAFVNAFAQTPSAFRRRARSSPRFRTILKDHPRPV